MKSIVSTETYVIENKEVTLVSVSGSSGAFGICDTTIDINKGKRETFFVGQEAIINLVQKSINDPYSNKLIWQTGSIDKCNEFNNRMQRASDDYFLHNKPVAAAMMPILEGLKNGLYIVHEAEMIPTDGAGNYFWSSFLVSHELGGSSTFDTTMKKHRSFTPSFLVPTKTITTFSESVVRQEIEKIKSGAETGGIAFHLSGMFSALLYGHHTATASLLEYSKFRCLLIEPVRYVLFGSEIEIAESEITLSSREPLQTNCDYLYTPYVKIPVAKISQSMLQNFFVTRETEIPKNYATIRSSAEKLSRLKGKRNISQRILARCEKLPDVEMLQSSSLISAISDEQIETLLRGETSIGDKVIISQNYYMSVVTVCNYLQYENFEKFMYFALTLLRDENMTAVHQYLANRVQNIMDERIDKYFEEISERSDTTFVSILPLAEKYRKRYKTHIAMKQNEISPEQIDPSSVLKRDTAMEINALEMAKKIVKAAK